jgi:hypothetical protein
MASRDLNDLRQDIRLKAQQHISLCASDGIDLLVYCTHRSYKEQDELYALGRSVIKKYGKTAKIVTNSRAGQSKHNHYEKEIPASLAYDCVPCIHGKPQWDNQALINKVGEHGESVGLLWAGRWSGRLKESVHFEI